jgi:hypothetical protein
MSPARAGNLRDAPTPPHRHLPGNAEPSEVLIKRIFIFGTTARGIDVLDPQQQAAARAPREIVVQQRRKSVAEMEVAIRARRKTENGWHQLATVVIAALDAAIHFSRLSYDRRWMAGSSPAMTKGES